MSYSWGMEGINFVFFNCLYCQTISKIISKCLSVFIEAVLTKETFQHHQGLNPRSTQ